MGLQLIKSRAATILKSLLLGTG